MFECTGIDKPGQSLCIHRRIHTHWVVKSWTQMPFVKLCVIGVILKILVTSAQLRKLTTHTGMSVSQRCVFLSITISAKWQQHYKDSHIPPPSFTYQAHTHTHTHTHTHIQTSKHTHTHQLMLLLFKWKEISRRKQYSQAPWGVSKGSAISRLTTKWLPSSTHEHVRVRVHVTPIQNIFLSMINDCSMLGLCL